MAEPVEMPFGRLRYGWTQGTVYRYRIRFGAHVCRLEYTSEQYILCNNSQLEGHLAVHEFCCNHISGFMW